jgi:prophage tail gpP-like protein
MPNPAEVCTMRVAGIDFRDWETVWVQSRYAESSPLFRFTAAERRDNPQYWKLLQFFPGDACTIFLGGQLAVTGVILTRQVAYEANNHNVMLIGKGVTWWAATSSVIHKTGNFDNQSFEQAARAVLAPHAVGVKVIGALDRTPFKRLQCEPGELVWDFCERIARPRGVVMGSDHLGNFLFIGKHSGEIVDHLVEGVNILRCQCIISKEDIYDPYIVSGQTPASDDKYGKGASEQEAQTAGTAPRFRPRKTPAEQPVWNIGEIQMRSRFEAQWGEGTILEATITVQGWLRGGTGQLWRAGDDVKVDSPMIPLNQVMKIKVATYTQDSNGGTLTTLDLVAPWLLNDNNNFNVGNSDAPAPPGEARNTSGDRPATPPAANPQQPGAEIKESDVQTTLE